MFPDNQNQNGGPPQPGGSYQPAPGGYQPPLTPQPQAPVAPPSPTAPVPQPAQPGYPAPAPPPYQTPTTGVNSAPIVAPNGQYEVVPPPSVTGRPTGHNPYEFIAASATQRPSTTLFGGDERFTKLVFIAGGAILLMIVAGIIISALGPKSINPQLVAVVQRQQEIIRIATEGQQATSQEVKNFTMSVELSTMTSQTQVVSYLSSHGQKKLSTKTLGLDHSAQTDQLLTTAQATNTFDTTLVQTLAEQLNTYGGLLKTTYQQISGPKAKALLQKNYTAAVLLAQQIKTVQSDIATGSS